MFKFFRLAVLLVGASLAFSLFAQSNSDTSDTSDTSDPPARVARLSYLHGAVSFVPAGENDWVEAQLNRPLISGDKLYTDRDARATLELGDSALRIDESSSFDFLNLDDSNAQIELTQGTLNLRVRRLYDGQSYEVDTPTLAFVATRVGEFRIDVAPSGDSTIVTVKSGGGDVYGEDNARFHVEEGQSVMFRDAQLRDYTVNDLPQPDAFDDFSNQRDRRWDDSTSRQYVSEDVIGYQDLDDNGQWSDVPEYGNVWYPSSVGVDWAPYRQGHWAWVGLYGWTWVDDAAWGFAPFHYGRWAYIGNRWGWCPGPRAIRPVYAPALVAFIGGRGVGLRVSSGPIGWFPLGRRDVYFPAYRVSERYFSRVNVSNTVINHTVINNYYGNYSRGRLDYAKISYANRSIAGAMTAVPASAFVNARSVSRSAIRINNTTFAKEQVHGFARLAPTRASLASSVTARARPVPAVLNRQVVAATRPPAPVAAFSTRRAAMANNPGRPLAAQVLRRPVGTAVTAKPGVMPARPNLRVVTQHGAPVSTAAPRLPPRAQDARRPTPATANPAERGKLAPGNNRGTPPARNNPAIERSRENVAPSRPNATPNRQHDAPERSGGLNSSRFAHPQPTPQTQPNNSVRTRPENVAPRGENNRATPRSTPQREQSRPPYRESRQATQQRQEYRPEQRQPRETHAPTPRPEYRQNAEPQRAIAPQAQPRQEYRQENRPTARPQNEVQRAAPRPEYRQQQPQPQPVMRAPAVRQPPQQAAPRNEHKNDSKDDNDDKRHRN